MQESRHACGLKLANGAQILLHIGIDTVAMKGDGFEYLVKEGQKVSAGTPLIKFDKKKSVKQVMLIRSFASLLSQVIWKI